MTTPPATDRPDLPDWLPDEATLSRLAGEFFRALPGQDVPSIGSPAQPVPPVGPAGAAAPVAASAPSGVEVPAGMGTPVGAPGVTATPGWPGPTQGPPSSTPAAHGSTAAGLGLPVTPGTPVVPTGSGAIAPVPTGLGTPTGPPGISAPPGRPVPTQPPPTSTPAAHGSTAAGLGLPYLPEVPQIAQAGAFPDPPSGVESASGPGMSGSDPAGLYFLDGGAPGSPWASALPSASPSIPALPSMLTVPSLPGLSLPGLSPATGGDQGAREQARFYFLDRELSEAVHGQDTLPSLPHDQHPGFDVEAVRADFPILSERVNGRPLIWMDNAATTQKPNAVIERLAEFYRRENSNIHRAAHELAARASDAYENARRTAAEFIGAPGPQNVVFVRGTTEAINLVAKAWGGRHVGAGDEIIISHLEHHANIVPWQMLAEQTGATIKVIPVDDDGQILLDRYTDLLSDRTKLVSITQVSNALGTVVPVKDVIELAHRAGAKVLVDAAQSVPHLGIDVQELGADFLAFSGHKIFGPTGIGVLYGTSEALEETPPWEGGGNMIADVTLERAVFQPPPGRFEAGTGNIADAAGLATALDYVSRIGLPLIAEYEHSLVEHATAGLREVPGLRLIGTAAEKASVVSFVLDGYDPPEVGAALNEEGIAVRAGHHCAQPILRRFGLEATVRPSLAFYNTHREVDTLISAVHRIAAKRPRS